MKERIGILLAILLLPNWCHAQADAAVAAIDTGDTAWMMISTALVILMTPAGLAIFYGGLTQSKSVLNTIGMTLVAFCTATLAWVLCGYSIAFGTDGGMVSGGLGNALLNNIGVTDVRGSIPTLIFVAFQGAFAAIAVAIVSGAVIERVKFAFWIVFSFLWVIVIYSPLAHWVWGGGFLSQNGELDFAGGTVIHINAGISGLVLASLMGKRKNYGALEAKPSSIKLTVLGTALLWFGWFGFNAGSALEANGIAANAFLVSNIAACAGGIGWMALEWISSGRPSLLGIASGIVSGLVAITPAAGYVDVIGSLAIGFIGGGVGYWGVVKLKHILKLDDALDAFGIHGLVGIWGSIAAGLFANPKVNGAAGLLYGNPGQVLTQLYAVVVAIIFSAAATFLLYKLTALITRGARVHERLEEQGLDMAYHGESGFNIESPVEHRSLN